jgi:putative molybdopterin biosynthesis protein
VDGLRLASVEEALSKLFSCWRPEVKLERVELSEALGRVLGVDVVASMDVPPFDRSAVDGYAVRAEDTFEAEEARPVRLKLAFKVPIGSAPPRPIEPGECAYVATGSMLPEGCDAVVMLEYTREAGGWVELYRSVAPRENVVKRGSDVRRGERLLRRGVRLRPRLLGLLASQGLREVEVAVKPKVAIASTGAELVEPGGSLREGMVYDVNSTSLSAMAREAGCDVDSLGIIPDDSRLLAQALEGAASTHDLILVSGGTSKGEGDLLPEALSQLPSAKLLVHGLALKPGKPTLLALIKGRPLVGLPGNPTSAMAVFHVLVEPIINAMLGALEEEALTLEAKAGVKMTSAKGRRELKFVRLERSCSELRAYPVSTGSESISTYALSHGYIDVAEGVEIIEEGEPVRVRLLR